MSWIVDKDGYEFQDEIINSSFAENSMNDTDSTESNCVNSKYVNLGLSLQR